MLQKCMPQDKIKIILDLTIDMRIYMNGEICIRSRHVFALHTLSFLLAEKPLMLAHFHALNISQMDQ